MKWPVDWTVVYSTLLAITIYNALGAVVDGLRLLAKILLEQRK